MGLKLDSRLKASLVQNASGYPSVWKISIDLKMKFIVGPNNFIVLILSCYELWML